MDLFEWKPNWLDEKMCLLKNSIILDLTHFLSVFETDKVKAYVYSFHIF